MKKNYGYDLKGKLDIYILGKKGEIKIDSIKKEHSFLKLLSKIRCGIFNIKDIDEDTLQIKSLYLDKSKYYIDEFLLRLDFFDFIESGSAGGLLKEISIYELLIDYVLLSLELDKMVNDETLKVLKGNKDVLEEMIFSKNNLLGKSGILINYNKTINKCNMLLENSLDTEGSIIINSNIIYILNEIKNFLTYTCNACKEIGIDKEYEFITNEEITSFCKVEKS